MQSTRTVSWPCLKSIYLSYSIKCVHRATKEWNYKTLSALWLI